MQELGEQVGELVPRRLAAGLLVDAHGGENRGQQQRARLGHEPLVARKRQRPIDIRLGIPLAFLAPFVEVAQLFHLAAVLPAPVKIERHVDIEATTQRGDRRVVDEVDYLEIAEDLTLIGKDLVPHAATPHSWVLVLFRRRAGRQPMAKERFDL